MTTKTRSEKVIEGLQILSEYDKSGCICAEHDTIYFGGVEKEKISTVDLAKLDELGWHYDWMGSWFKNV